MIEQYIEEFQVLQRQLANASDENVEGDLLHALNGLCRRLGNHAEDERRAHNFRNASLLECLALEIWKFEEVVRRRPPPGT